MHLCHRNTRRYGGYIVHFGVIVVMIGFAGSAFNQEKEQEMGFGDKMTIGAYTLVCRSYTQEDNPNYGSEWAIIGRLQGRQADRHPVSRAAFLSRPASRPRPWPPIRSTLKEDLYLVYEGKNQDTGRPIIKAHLNPLVMWIWVGVWIMIVGTVLALVPNAVPARVAVTGAGAGRSRRERAIDDDAVNAAPASCSSTI